MISNDYWDVRLPNEKKVARVGLQRVALRSDGVVNIGGVLNLTKEDVQDLLVALDAVQGDQPDPSPANLRETIIGGAHALARDIYRQTAYRAIVDVGLHPDLFFRIASDDDRLDRRYERGSVRVSPDVELSVARELVKR